LTDSDYWPLAHFIAFAAARTRRLMDHVAQCHEKTDESVVRAWSEGVGLPFTEESEKWMLKDSLLTAMVRHAVELREKLLSAHWSFLRVPRETPFITSDWPVLTSTEGDSWVQTFAVSSEVAFLISNDPGATFRNPGPEDVRAVNVNTMSMAERFVVCHKDSFPGDEKLSEWASARLSP
jgi:hypothetical protein